MIHKEKRTITYYYRGLIERPRFTGSKSSWWVPGYSEVGENGGTIYPWKTYRECVVEAKAAGCIAKMEVMR